MTLNQKFFNEIKKHVEQTKVQDIDHFMIEAAANCLHIYTEAVKEIKTHGIDACYEVYQKGSNVTGIYTVMHKELDKFLNIARRLGLDPDSRDKIKKFGEKAKQLTAEEKKKLRLTR